MRLSQDELQRVEFLLGKDQSGIPLTPAEKAEVRSLLAHESPRAPTMDWESVVQVGLVVAGVHALSRVLRGART